MRTNENEDNTVSLWLGCTTRFFFKNTVKSIKSIFKKINIDYKLLDEKENRYSCCASTLWGIGLKEYAEDNRSKLEQTLEKEMANRALLVSPCPGCTRIFKKKYDFDPKPLHITEFLFNNLDIMKFENSNPIQVSYHDSCHLARGLEVMEEPRRILEKIPNLTLKELSYRGKETLCCGSGGGMRAYNRDLADSMSSMIVKEAVSLGSSALVTACPFCERSFNEGRNLIEADIGIWNLLTIVDEYLS